MMEHQFQQPMPIFQGYGINPAYATPAYMANFRPAYAQAGFSNNPYADSAIPSEGRMMDTVIPFPFSNNTNFATDPMVYNASLGYGMNNSFMDAASWGAQRIGVPIAAWYAANKFLNIKTAAPHGSVAAQASRVNAYGKALLEGRGLAGASAAYAGAMPTQSLGGRMGAWMGQTAGRLAGVGVDGVSRTVGLGAAPRAAGWLARGGALAGGVAGSFALPFAAAIAASEVAEDALFDPYVAIRRGEDALLANTANRFVGGSLAPTTGRFGMSHEHAETLSRALVDSSTNDFAFDKHDYNIMADYGMRMGLMNDIGNLNVEDMKKRVEGMADTVKLIMAVANTSSVKEAIEYMGRLKAGGVTDPGVASRVMSSLGASSNMSGTSVEQIMNTVGNQGQLMFQRSGMLPVLGQLSSAALYSGFANAYKSGVLSTENLFSLGGVEGATQYAMEGSLGVLNSNYATMALMTGRGFNGGQTGLVDTVSAFGQLAADDPFRLMGDIALNRDVYASERIAEQGLEVTTLQAILGQITHKPGHMYRDSNGKVDATKLAGILSTEFGMSSEQIRALYHSMNNLTDGASIGRMEQVNDASATKLVMQNANQEGMLLAGTDAGRWWHSLRGQWKEDVVEGIFNPIGGFFTDAKASLNDSTEAWLNSLSGVKTLTEQTYYNQDKETGALDAYRVKSRSLQHRRDGSFMGESNRYDREGLALFRSLMSASKAGGETGDLAKSLLSAWESGTMGEVEDLEAKLMTIHEATNNNALRVTAGRDAYEESQRVADLLKRGSMVLEKTSTDNSDNSYRVAANRNIAQALHVSKRESASTFDKWGRRSGLKEAREEGFLSGVDEFEASSHEEVFGKLIGDVLHEDSDISNTIGGILNQAGMREALMTPYWEQTKEQAALADQLRSLSDITGINYEDLKKGALGGENTNAYRKIIKDTSNTDMTDKVLQHFRNMYELDPQMALLVAAQGDSRKLQAYGNLDEESWAKLDRYMVEGRRPALTGIDQIYNEEGRRKKAGELIDGEVSGLSESMRDFQEVSSAMKGVAGDFERSTGSFRESTQAIQQAARVMDDAARTMKSATTEMTRRSAPQPGLTNNSGVMR